MLVFLLYDYGDLVGIYSSYEAADVVADVLRKDARETIGDDALIEVISYQVKE